MNQVLVGRSPSLTQHGAGVVGPNAVLQLIGPLNALVGDDGLHTVFSRAGVVRYLSQPPLAMVPEEHALRLFKAVSSELPEQLAQEVLTEAGRGTAEYVIANRIPGPARALLRLLPTPLAAPLLCRAIKSHAWTFAGSGRCEASGVRRIQIDITDNPLATPNCPWHSAVLLTMFRSLVHRSMVLEHSYCCARGDAFCRFELGPP